MCLVSVTYGRAGQDGWGRFKTRARKNAVSSVNVALIKQAIRTASTKLLIVIN